MSSEGGRREGLRLLMIEPSSRLGGQEEVLFNLAVTLPAYGVHPHVVALRDGPMLNRLREAEVTVELVSARLRQPSKVQRAVRVLDAKLRSGEFDAVYSNMPMAHLYAAGPAKLRRVPALWCQMDYPDPPNWLHRLASKLPADGIIAESTASVAAQQKLTDKPVHLMHLGIDLDRFGLRSDAELRSRHKIPAHAPLVSIIGRLEEWKGQRQFLHAAALVAERRPDVRFAVVGGAILGWEGDYPDELQRLCEDLGLQDRVTFTGHTTEASRWFAASNVTVNASNPEPFGLVVIEAMSSGCAVVAINNGGPRDVIESGTTGILVAGPDPALISAAILDLLAEPDRALTIGRAGREHVLTHFSRVAMTERFVAIMREALERRTQLS